MQNTTGQCSLVVGPIGLVGGGGGGDWSQTVGTQVRVKGGVKSINIYVLNLSIYPV